MLNTSHTSRSRTQICGGKRSWAHSFSLYYLCGYACISMHLTSHCCMLFVPCHECPNHGNCRRDQKQGDKEYSDSSKDERNPAEC